jgi:hypothetical protein
MSVCIDSKSWVLSRLCGFFGAVLIGLGTLASCQKPELPPVAYQGPTLAGADLGLAQTVTVPDNGYAILGKQDTQGRFPAALAVVRLDKPNPLFVSDDPLFVSERGWEVANLPTEEAVWWNTLFKTVPQSRAVYILDRAGVISPDCDLKQVIEAVQRIHVELCLIYGPRSVPDDCAGLAGVILDVNSGQYLAYVQSQAGITDFEPPRPDRPKHDLSHQDVNYISARRFEQQVRACVLELIASDKPAATTQPSPWRDMEELRLPADSVPAYIVPNHKTGR